MKDFFYKYSDRDDLIAIRTTNQKILYKELFLSAKELSSKLTSLKNSGNKYIPILSKNNIELVITTIALWNIGLVPAPINTRWTTNEIELVLTKNNFEYVIFEKIFYEKLKTSAVKKISFDEVLGLPTRETDNVNNDEAVVIFTSGSTGEPKGVVHTFTSLSNSIKNGSAILNQNVSDRWLASLQIICRALSQGCEIIIPENPETESLKKSIEQFNPTHLSLVSTQMQRLIESNVKVNDELKVTLVGGGFSEDDLIIKAHYLGWKPIRVYGSSETASFITAASAEEIKLKPGTVGKPVKNSEIKISDENEIIISTDSLFKGYLNNPEETHLKFKDGFYHSGDIGRIDEDGYLFVEARRTDFIITGGENVIAFEVENALRKIDGVSDTCVFPIQDIEWGQIVACAIVLSEPLTEEFIINELKKSLSSYKIPKKIYFVNELPRTALGKIEREKVRKLFENK